jgi:hypothetical protein
MSAAPRLSAADLEQLAAAGISAVEAERQLALLAAPPPPTRLARPCRLGDGIVRLEAAEHAALLEAGEAAAAEGRLTVFVPASGAATRMFASLLPALAEERPLRLAEAERRAAGGDAAAADLVRFCRHLRDFAFAEDLGRALAARGLDLYQTIASGDVRPVVETLLGPEGLDYAALPKALIPFHRYPDGPRTALEEQVIEAARYASGRDRECRLSFTVPRGHEERFRRLAGAAAQRSGVEPRLELSHQEPSTDTLAVDDDGRPARCADGSLLLRPGGHGALLGNLERSGADLAVVKNIDNVVPDRLKDTTARWKKLLVGYLTSLQAALGHHLQRPLRVCGVVANQGQPGGGPFWVHGADGRLSVQIVESAQVDLNDREQRAIWQSATHFNPVDLACALRDPRGRPYVLGSYVDPQAVFIAAKHHDGRPLRALEHPGLWNGAMADWYTVFVEVPAETFAPVKTVLDLLRPEHQS